MSHKYADNIYVVTICSYEYEYDNIYVLLDILKHNVFKNFLSFSVGYCIRQHIALCVTIKMGLTFIFRSEFIQLLHTMIISY